MGFTDVLYNVLSIAGLGLLSVRARIAFDERRWGRVTFCIAFGLFVARSLVLRWLSGVNQSWGIKPDANWRDFLSSTFVALVITILFFIGLLWATIEEYHEFKRRRMERRLLKKQKQELITKDKEIDRLNQKATMHDAARESPWRGLSIERRKVARPKREERNDYGLHA
jgi:hypothetical protein